MARLRDALPAIRAVGPLKFFKTLYNEVVEDNLFTWAAALAYSWLFAIFPFFIFLLSLLPLLPGQWKSEAQKQISDAVNRLPADAQVTLHEYLDPKLEQLLYKPPKGIWSIGLLVTIWAASGGMAMTMSALDKCYDVKKPRPYYVNRPIAVGLTLVVATLIIVVIALLPIGTLITRELTEGTNRLLRLTPATQPAVATATPAEVSSTAPASTQAAATRPFMKANPVSSPRTFTAFLVLWQIGRYGLALLLLLWVAALIYHYGPNVERKFHLLTPGAVFTVAVWIGLGFAFRIYVDRFGKYGETYGAVGGVIILLFFFYLDALVLLVGAEIDAEIELAVKTMTGEVEPSTETLIEASEQTPPGSVDVSGPKSEATSSDVSPS